MEVRKHSVALRLDLLGDLVESLSRLSGESGVVVAIGDRNLVVVLDFLDDGRRNLLRFPSVSRVHDTCHCVVLHHFHFSCDTLVLVTYAGRGDPTSR